MERWNLEVGGGMVMKLGKIEKDVSDEMVGGVGVGRSWKTTRVKKGVAEFYTVSEKSKRNPKLFEPLINRGDSDKAGRGLSREVNILQDR